ncbi:Aste57867_3356 [Aphanomyces stellatus]|uniref:Aste57867_3356 protein n=1 Tax=Aphanomyces stellatus TaxID=120398 RepID=A0A485KB75_9STRA|nr:hypothetical protein As57867_003346 [Aphanomyces stellatus]VFT80524.1 Aste57867_3356 [Aphanomyces stellatus]
MLARLTLPTPSRKKYEQVMLLPRKELSKLDLSPPKPKTSALVSLVDDKPPLKQKELTDDENNAIWRRWKEKKDAQRRQAAAQLRKDVEVSVQQGRTSGGGGPDDANSGFSKWKHKKDEERRREKQRRREEEAAWEREKQAHLDALREKLPPTAMDMAATAAVKPKVDPQRILQVQEKVQASPYAKSTRRRSHASSFLPTLPQLTKAAPKAPRPMTGVERPPTELSTLFLEAPAVDIQVALEARHFPQLADDEMSRTSLPLLQQRERPPPSSVEETDVAGPLERLHPPDSDRNDNDDDDDGGDARESYSRCTTSGYGNDAFEAT